MNKLHRIIITPGEPAGIGPEILIKLIQKPHAAELVVAACPDLLSSTAKRLNIPLNLYDFNKAASPLVQKPGQLGIIPIPLPTKAIPGVLNKTNAHYVLDCIKTAVSGCMDGVFDALVTGPIHKGIINEAGIKFSGHTEYLAMLSQSKHTVMMLQAKEMRVALLTTHIALSEVSSHVTSEHLRIKLQILSDGLSQYFNIKKPKILVCGLNPHAGENGHLGREEIDVMIPAIEALKKEGMHVEGPLPADTIFTPKYLEHCDVVLAMYHDQGLPVLKFFGFGQAVNITLGLPFIRTSVDHGTALDIADRGIAEANSLNAALEKAIQMSDVRKVL